MSLPPDSLFVRAHNYCPRHDRHFPTHESCPDCMAEYEMRKATLATFPKDTLLAEREKTHGSFQRNAELWRKLTDVFEEYCDVRLTMTVKQQLALSMTFSKLARLAQRPDFRDHWRDAGKYLEMGGEDCTDDIDTLFRQK